MNATPIPPGKEDLLELTGSIENIIYQNDETGYTVCELAASDDDLVTLVGIMPFMGIGETVKVLGRWELHASFGRQFKVEYYEKHLPSDEVAMLKYLSSGAIKGIGPVLAQRIIDKFGADAFDVIENNPEWLADVDGITRKKAQKLSERFRETFGVRSVMMFCRDFFGPATAVKVYKKWGGGAVDVIKANPYALCESIHGIGFETADRIAESLGTDKDSPDRLRAGIVWFLSYNASQNGHVFIPTDKLLPAAAQFLGAAEESVKTAANALINGGRIVSVKYGGREVYYLNEYFEAERYAAAKLDQLDRLCERISVRDVGRFIDQIEAELDITYAAKQREAIAAALNSGVMILTGGPGTGKTTVIRAVITVFQRMGLGIVLAAPTGRAAKRMSEATSCEAKTIHRLLETDFSGGDEPKFRRDEHDMLDEDVIIIDEASMVDTLLFASLLKAVKPGARLILIGDADQLPSVGAGFVLNDLLESRCFSSVRLTEIFRQAESSLIVRNAHAVNRGEMPDLTVKDNDFFFLPRENGRATAETVADLCANRLPRRYGEEIRRGIQVITPSHKGPAGTDYLNAALQAALNPPAFGKNERKLRERLFREGDKVMQTKNNYDMGWEKNGAEGIGIFNGDIGFITEISPSAETVTVSFDERTAVYDFTQLDELELAYAITIHKSQGSEYPVVILPLCDYSPRLLTRNLLYTAITRAKDMVVAVGAPSVVEAMVSNNRQVNRYTGLAMLIRSYRD
ncbi:MAG: ATP-dependent RecD-like DNA helicase [Clostridia bacterium]|nr:ATP-dependent RecD-like DNA helicase [Clostridia bacterium]